MNKIIKYTSPHILLLYVINEHIDTIFDQDFLLLLLIKVLCFKDLFCLTMYRAAENKYNCQTNLLSNETQPELHT